MSQINVYINNAVKMMSLYVQNGKLINDHYNVEQLAACSRMILSIQSLLGITIIEHVEIIENWEYRKNAWLKPVLWLLDLKMIFWEFTPENGLKLLAANIAKPSFISRKALSNFTSSNWLSKIEKAHSKSNHGILPLPALYWACFIKHNYLKYEN